MIDNFAILFSTIGVLYVVWRAVTLDRILPWFETRSLYEEAERRRAAEPPKKPSPRGLLAGLAPPPMPPPRR